MMFTSESCVIAPVDRSRGWGWEGDGGLWMPSSQKNETYFSYSSKSIFSKDELVL